jgi:DNA-binding PadR family transcriptional regulator
MVRQRQLIPLGNSTDDSGSLYPSLRELEKAAFSQAMQEKHALP